MIEILNRWTSAVMFKADVSDVKGAVVQAISENTNLKGANLKGANLEGANLEGANLEGAYLEGAYLEGAYLVGASLEGAYLVGASLEGAYLMGASLMGANLKGANLEGANLMGASLMGANLEGAHLAPIRDDLWAVLSATPHEATALRSALAEGRVDGSQYEGECACLVGTLANARHCKFNNIPDLKPDSSRPAERFFMMIRKGDTPENNQASKIAIEWVDQWLANVRTLVGA